jgi:hypothetical protein
MKRIIIIIWIFLILLSGGYLVKRTIFKSEPIHIHAGFQVYKDNKLVDFSDFKYMHEMPCTINGKPVDDHEEDEQIEKAHLHDQVGDVVHVHRENAVWRDLFANIKYPIEGSFVAYVNGKKVDNVLDHEIVPYETITIFIGQNSDQETKLRNAVKKERIEQIENKSENCSS